MQYINAGNVGPRHKRGTRCSKDSNHCGYRHRYEATKGIPSHVRHVDRRYRVNICDLEEK